MFPATLWFSSVSAIAEMILYSSHWNHPAAVRERDLIFAKNGEYADVLIASTSAKIIAGVFMFWPFIVNQELLYYVAVSLLN